MTGRAAAVFGLVLLNAFFGWEWNRLRGERSQLVRRSQEVERLAIEREEAKGHRRQVGELVARAEGLGLSSPLDISRLREALLEAERGLPLERLSLDFRPEPDVASGFGGARVHLSLRGPFTALYTYLDRIEALRLPLAPEELSLRYGPAGEVNLDGRWTARYRVGIPENLPALSAADVRRLAAWLASESASEPRRLFAAQASEREALRAISPARIPADVRPSEAVAPEEAPPPRPVLTGFVLARPEAEPDVTRRVLAAVRFQGELLLVRVGDSVGDYRVEGIDPRESLTLVHRGTEERLVLRLQ